MRDFQNDALKKLGANRSILIVAPTGLGKTRAALYPFVKNKGGLLGTRLLYNLPVRVLTKGVVKEFNDISNSNMVVHHGEEPESEIFSEQAVVTTVDQYFTAFAGAPLSWASSAGHAAAGAILTSYSVFDEVHLLSPRCGLPLLFAILKLRQRWGVLSCVMTATLPQSAVDFISSYCGLDIVYASKNDVADRDSWRRVRVELHGKLDKIKSNRDKKKDGVTWNWSECDIDSFANLVKTKWESWDTRDLNGFKKIIVFINTVERAIQLYEKLKNSFDNSKILLAHSRFIKEDRQKVEENLTQRFGQNSEFEGILITTQVAEAGLNISAPLVITELCPMDSLIQRAGRCQRFNSKKNQEMRGHFLIVKPKVKEMQRWYSPYVNNIAMRDHAQFTRIPIAELTRYVLEENYAEREDFLLNWEVEKNLIDQALSEVYLSFLRGEDAIDYEKIRDKPLGKVYQQLKKIKTEGKN